MDSAVLAEFGERVRAARDVRGWTQEQLGERTGLTRVQISRIEHGAREIRLTTLLRLLAALHIPSTQLIEGLHSQNP